MASPVIPRSQWSDVHATFDRLTLPVPEAALHHQGGAGPTATTLAALESWLRSMEHGEMARGDGLRALAYHRFVINGGPFRGYRFESRPYPAEGGATLHHNDTSIAVCVSGCFQAGVLSKDHPGDELTPEAFDSVAQEFADAIRVGVLSPHAIVQPHSLYYPTACPGDNLRDALPDLRVAIAQKLSPDLSGLVKLVALVKALTTKPLRLGQKGPRVVELHRLLVKRGYPAVRGAVYTKETAQYIRDWKTKRKLKSRDGKVCGSICITSLIRGK